MLFKNVILNSRTAFRLWLTDESLQLNRTQGELGNSVVDDYPQPSGRRICKHDQCTFPNVSVSYRPVVPRT